MKRITLADVARLAQVSRTTASYVINEQTSKARISEETSQRVQQAIEALGYTPSFIGRSLRRQKTEMIALAVQDITNSFYPRLSVAVQETMEKSGYDVLLYNLASRPGRERNFLDLVRRRRLDGVILLTWSLSPADIESLTNEGIPSVFVTSGTGIPGVDTVGYDNVVGARKATEYLYGQNHRRIAHITGLLSTNPGQSRLAGYREALAGFGIPNQPELVQEGDFMSGSGGPAMLELLRLPEPPSAVFVANDLMALEAILAAQEAGWRVPEDIAVIGFDDIPEATMVRPPLTTIRQDAWELGGSAARLLLDRLDDSYSGAARHVSLQHQLVVRASA